MTAQENKLQISQNDIFIILVKFDIYFLRLPWEIVFGVITNN